MSGDSTSGLSIPATYSHMPEPVPVVTQIRSPGKTWSMPSSWAAAAQRTATGSFRVAAFRNSPWATDVPAVAGRPRVAASTVSAFVFTLGISGLR
jgi:hypothetical protein